ncbi:MAG: sodium-dependent transporter [Candidatus Weimeria sp.]
MENKPKRGSFTGQLGFVLAAAGSAVGVGNLWRFPYLAAKDGGGLFIIIYLILVVTFGFTLLTSDITIGRKTGKSAIGAYTEMNPKWKFLGVLTFFVPVIIMTYYAVIGGWIAKYMVAFMTGDGQAAAKDGYFTSFISDPVQSCIYAVIFMVVTAVIIYRGVEKGIEGCSKFMMPVLLVLIIFVAVYSLFIHHGDRNGVEGFLVYITPDVKGLTVKKFMAVLLDAMSQLFFSLSVSMGIMITYGSYVKKDVDLNRSISQIEIFDTGVALLAGMAIIPAIYVFSGLSGMNAGPGLMFISLPKVFASMGFFGNIVGAAFFIMAVFATLTSCISVLEAITANCMEVFHTDRHRTTLALGIIYTIASVVISLGYSVFYCEIPLPNGNIGQLLDLMDYVSNSVMMPFISFLSTILIGWIVRPQWIIGEIESSGVRFHRKQLYVVMVKFVCPVIMIMLFLQSTGLLSKL